MDEKKIMDVAQEATEQLAEAKSTPEKIGWGAGIVLGLAVYGAVKLGQTGFKYGKKGINYISGKTKKSKDVEAEATENADVITADFKEVDEDTED